MHSASRAKTPARPVGAAPFLGLGLIDAEALRASAPRRGLRIVATPKAGPRAKPRAVAGPPRPAGRRLQIRLCRETSGS